MSTKNILRLIHEDDGMNMVEYALVGALVSVAAVGVLRLLGPALGELFGGVSAELD
jgi:Flp pilus assembly pilin Flp